LNSIMHCISDQETQINQAAKSANTDLINLIQTTTENIQLKPLLNILISELTSEHTTTRITSLLWIKMLHEKNSTEMNKLISVDLLPLLLKTISDDSDEVVLINLQVLASISDDKVQFNRILNSLVMLFLEDRVLLEVRGALVIRKLCVLLDCKSIYLSLAKILGGFPNLEFVSYMVQTLNLILLTAPELFVLRNILKNCINAKKKGAIVKLTGGSKRHGD